MTTVSGQAGVEATAVASALQAGVQATEAGRTGVNDATAAGQTGVEAAAVEATLEGQTGVFGGDSGAVETRQLWGRREWRRHRQTLVEATAVWRRERRDRDGRGGDSGVTDGRRLLV